ncbi:MAG: hypothetical protein R3236_10885, partial [Phycisphaeraceae bacterium]|nr:hypothetical protein [Phycisphaeraceae bacterium]
MPSKISSMDLITAFLASARCRARSAPVAALVAALVFWAMVGSVGSGRSAEGSDPTRGKQPEAASPHTDR